MIDQVHHEPEAKKVLARVQTVWDCQTAEQKVLALEVMAKTALRELTKLKGLDNTMCFMWPMMEKMNDALQRQNEKVE